MLDDFKSLFRLAQIGQSRTSITNPLQWTLVILVIAIVAFSLVHVPAWFLDTLLICLIVILGLFAYAYLFNMHTNPDNLRSEHYHLSKMAIERGLIGDSLHGVTQSQDLKSEPKLIAGEVGQGASNE